MKHTFIKFLIILIMFVTGITFHFGYKFGCSIWENYQPKTVEQY